MSTRVCIVRKRATVREVARMMRDEQVEHVIVLGRDGEIFGVISERDVVVQAVASHRDVVTMQIAELVPDGPEPLRVEPTTPLDAAVRLMRAKRMMQIPVVCEGAVVGILCLRDVSHAEDPRAALG
ncbi:MAG: CBS domain-containing protein [Deltaproteobacteria bacterium]|nr:CBS domain-containing protein [Deltaproteobacteria bacterium]